MSYILDALKRADAERDRGAVPGLNARPVVLPAATGPRAPALQRWLPMVAALALGAAGAGLRFWRSSAPTPPAVPATARPAAQATPPVPPPTAALPVAPTVAAPVASTAPTAPAPVKLMITVSPVAPTEAAPPRRTPVSGAAAKAEAQPAAPVEKPPLLADLPADLRSQLPKITINGAVYSKDPTQRLLLVNNQVFTQGAVIGAGLTLQEIQAHDAIFDFHGTRFRMAH